MMQTMRETTTGTNVQRPGGFFKKLSPAALRDFESMEFSTLYQPGVLLFSEKSLPEGKRLILSIAKAGEVLGLSSILSALPSEMTAEILFPSRIAVIERDQFLAFMARHPEVYAVVTQELSMQYKVACEQLRTVALAGSAPEKLARLLLDWSENGQKTENGFRFRFSLTHEEIGEFIGASRETVTRTLSIFKSRRLVAFHGSMLEIPSKVALQNVAGV
jgi:CRP/FNR family transcriptional regulator